MEEFQQSHAELVKKRDDTYKEIIEIQRKLERLKQKVTLTEYTIQHNCIKYNQQHVWEVEREDGPYGERFFICKNCQTTR